MPRRRTRRGPKLVVVLPALNEEKTIARVLGDIPRALEGIGSVALLVVDDGSTDHTRAEAEGAGAHVVSHGQNRGVGAAMHTGLRSALEDGADIVVSMDSDGQFNPADIPLLVGPILRDEADFVTASRFKDADRIPEMSATKLWGNRRMSWLISWLTGQRFHDVSCGFRAYTRDTVLRLNLFGEFTYTQETFLDLAFKGLRLCEVPVTVRGERQFGKSRVASNLFRYAFHTSKIIVRTFRDYRPLRFFGSLASLFLGSGLLLFIFLGLHYVVVGSFSPHKWAGFTGGFLCAIGMIVLVTGLMADMLARIRRNQEELLYYERRRQFGPKAEEGS